MKFITKLFNILGVLLCADYGHSRLMGPFPFRPGQKPPIPGRPPLPGFPDKRPEDPVEIPDILPPIEPGRPMPIFPGLPPPAIGPPGLPPTKPKPPVPPPIRPPQPPVFPPIRPPQPPVEPPIRPKPPVLPPIKPKPPVIKPPGPKPPGIKPFPPTTSPDKGNLISTDEPLVTYPERPFPGGRPRPRPRPQPIEPTTDKSPLATEQIEPGMDNLTITDSFQGSTTILGNSGGDVISKEKKPTTYSPATTGVTFLEKSHSAVKEDPKLMALIVVVAILSSVIIVGSTVILKKRVCPSSNKVTASDVDIKSQTNIVNGK